MNNSLWTCIRQISKNKRRLNRKIGSASSQRKNNTTCFCLSCQRFLLRLKFKTMTNKQHPYCEPLKRKSWNSEAQMMTSHHLLHSASASNGKYFTKASENSKILRNEIDTWVRFSRATASHPPMAVISKWLNKSRTLQQLTRTGFRIWRPQETS